MPIAIEVFDLDARDASVRIDINGMPWAVVARTQLPEMLAEIGRAYAQGEVARLLGRILAAAGDTETAAKLYRNVLEWTQTPRRHGPRESLFLALAEDPAAAASAGLADLGDARPVTAAAVAPV